MSIVREQFLPAAKSAVILLNDPAVAAAWDRPSALQHFSVHGLAGHLARQVLLVPRLLAQPVPDGPAVSLLDHYAAVPWANADLDSEVNRGVRQGGEAEAAEGAAALATTTGAVVTALRSALPAEPAERLVHLPWVPWSLSLDDFLVTRMMEIMVHADDLAVSVGVTAPALPEEVTDLVLGLLVKLAARRHGPTAVLRALSRQKRAPAGVSAF